MDTNSTEVTHKSVSMEAVAGLAAEVEKVARDKFQPGDVVRWTVEGGTKDYHYAAMRTPDGLWYTTSTRDSGLVKQILSYEGLIKQITSTRARNVAVAAEWASL